MQQPTAKILKSSPYKRLYGFIALVLLVAFVVRVSVICISGSGFVKTQQLLIEDDQDQNEKQQDAKANGQKFAELIIPSSTKMPGLMLYVQLVTHPVQPSLCIKLPLIAVITPPPDRFSA